MQSQNFMQFSHSLLKPALQKIFLAYYIAGNISEKKLTVHKYPAEI